VSEWLNVPESTVIRWVRQRHLPARRVSGQHRFNRAEVLEWATANQIKISPDVVHNISQREPHRLSLAASLARGGIYYDVAGASKSEVFDTIVRQLPLSDQTDRSLLLHLLLAREASASTALGSGIAIPHVRYPIVESIEQAQLSAAFLTQPIEFGAPDGQPVHTIFTIISPNPRGHMQVLSRLSLALHDAALCDALIRRAPREQILDEFRRVESGLGATNGGSGKATS
jgi:PTS system nitrogen regulatory IIA component